MAAPATVSPATTPAARPTAARDHRPWRCGCSRRGLFLTTVALFATGVLLLVDSPGNGSLKFLHKVSFILWFALMLVHVLGHVLELPALAMPDWRSKGGREAALAGPGLRLALLGTSLLAGLALALTTYHLAGPWLSGH